MNFKEFVENVKGLESTVNLKQLNPELIKVGHTRSNGEEIIWLIHEDKVIDYIKW